MNPKATVTWIKANAGSGKTYALTQHYLRQVLLGHKIKSIACLTFTTAAAQEMRDRIMGVAKKWRVWQESSLIEDLHEIIGFKPTEKIVFAARSLYSNLMAEYDGIKISTIHSFCIQIIQEYNRLSPDDVIFYQILNDQEKIALFDQAIKDIFTVDDASLTLRDSVDFLLANISDVVLKESLSFAMQELNILSCLESYSIETYRKALREKLELREDESIEGVLNTVSHLFDKGSLVNKENFFKVRHQYLTVKNSVRKAKEKDRNAGLIYTCNDKILKMHTLDLSCAFFVLCKVLHSYLDHLKQKAQKVEFNDLLLSAIRILKRQDCSSAILYSLGVKQILIDEAQDLNGNQWELVDTLCENFFFGLSEDSVRQAMGYGLFVVGDEKQSIYSFQGAVMSTFQKQENYYRGLCSKFGGEFLERKLETSYRSVGAILNFVDHLFTSAIAASWQVTHSTIHDSKLGAVCVWQNGKQEWGGDEIEEDSNVEVAVEVADKIAGQIQRWLQERKYLSVYSREIEPSDILILIRNRKIGSFYNITQKLEDSLSRLQIPCSVDTSVKLQDYLVVQDVIQMLRFCLLPHEDLSLAQVLTSNFFGIAYAELEQFCVLRKESLYGSLISFAKESPEALLQNGLTQIEIANKLEEFRLLSVKMPFYDFFIHVLNFYKLKTKLTSKELNALEKLHEFAYNMHLSLSGQITLSQFVSDINNFEIEHTQSADVNNKNCVKVTTCHKSKGLEAPIVILVNFADERPHPVGNLMTKDDIFFFRDSENRYPSIVSSWKSDLERELNEEEMRVLYVALTRAAQELHIVSYGKAHDSLEQSSDKEEGEGSYKWHNVINFAMQTSSQHWRLEGSKSLFEGFNANCKDANSYQELTEIASDKEDKGHNAIKLIKHNALNLGYFRRPQEQMPERESEAREYGVCLHAILSKITPKERDVAKIAALLGYIAKSKVVAMAIKSVLEILSHEKIGEIFTQEAKTEYHFCMKNDFNDFTFGYIDRIIFGEKCTTIIDYKTHATRPDSNSEEMKQIKLQLHRYKSAVSKMNGDKPIKCFILWTSLMEIEEMCVCS